MKRISPVLLLILAGVLLFSLSGEAQAAVVTKPAAGSSLDSTSQPLCLPGIYMADPGNCIPAGPSAYLTQMAEKGITFPMTAVPGVKPDFSYTYIDTRYGQVRTQNAPVYGSMEDALANKKNTAIRKITASFGYISYTEDAVVDGRRVYQIEHGAWMTAVDIVRIGAVPLFQGLTFDRTPERPFGWVLAYLSPGPVETKRTPGYQTRDYTGNFINNHQIVWSYAEETVDGTDWYMVGPDEWLPGNTLARVIPNTTPPEGVTNGRWIEINLFEQTLAVYDQHELIFATLIASGLEPFWTRPGLFQIYQKLETTPMSGAFEADRSDAYYLEDVPWTMYYDDAIALHGAYWRANLGFPQSHGCVNLSVGDSHWLYEWANEGDWVYVWDPSGKTPTDPKFFKAGGY
jgi:hypothetical protein